MGGALGAMDENREGTRKYNLVVTEQSWACKVRCREHSQQCSNKCVCCEMGVRVPGMISHGGVHLKLICPV